jgi:hypothetical protein
MVGDPPVWRVSPVPLAMANLDALAAENDMAGLHLLPEAIRTLTSQPRFNDLVDAEALKRGCNSPGPHGQSLAPLRACWLASQRVEPESG